VKLSQTIYITVILENCHQQFTFPKSICDIGVLYQRTRLYEWCEMLALFPSPLLPLHVWRYVMKNMKSIMMAIPLALALSAPAMAEMSDSAGAGPAGASPVSIDSLLNQYAGLAPGSTGSAGDIPAVPSWDSLTTFTDAVAPMSSYYTVMGGTGGARLLSGHNSSDVSGEAAAPAVARITVSHYVAEAPLSASGEGLTPTSSGSSSPSQLIGSTDTTLANTSGGGVIISGDTTLATPIPAAIFLFGSGLALLAPLGRKLRLLPS